MPGSTTINVSHSGGVRVIAYARPETHNAWNIACVRETMAAIIAANGDPQVGAIVLTGEGDSYCSGADLKDREFDPESGRRLSPASFTMGQGERNWLLLLAQSKPVIAAINGPAIGLGATHTLSADIRVMAASATLAFPFLRLGAMPECGSTALLPRLVGEGRARQIILFNETIDAARAVAWGLASQVIPDDTFREQAVALAQQLANLPPLQMRLTKRMLSAQAASNGADAIMRVESETFIEFLKQTRRDKPL